MRAQLAATVLAYYASSVLTSCLTKELLTRLPRPLTIALLQQVVAAAVGAWDHRRRSGEPVLAYERHWHAALPASSALVVAAARGGRHTMTTRGGGTPGHPGCNPQAVVAP